MKLRLSVPDMSCEHCRMTLERALREVTGVEKVIVRLGDKTVEVDGNVDLDAVEQTIREAGYTPAKG